MKIEKSINSTFVISIFEVLNFWNIGRSEFWPPPQWRILLRKLKKKFLLRRTNRVTSVVVQGEIDSSRFVVETLICQSCVLLMLPTMRYMYDERSRRCAYASQNPVDPINEQRNRWIRLHVRAMSRSNRWII